MGLTRPKLAQISTTTSAFDDPIIVLNNNASGSISNDKDIGIVFERGGDTNQVLLWDESADEFVLASSNEQGSTAGDVALIAYAPLQVAGLKASSFVLNGTLTFPTSDGTNGQVLSTNGSGTLSFVDVATTLDAVTDNGATTTNSIEVGAITVSGNIVPSANETYSLGTAENRFSTLHVAQSTVYLGDVALSIVGGELYVDGNPVAGSGDLWPGNNGNYDLSKPLDQNTAETPFEEGGTDSFGVSLAIVFDNMDPGGQVITYDFSDSYTGGTASGSPEAYVGA
jgi:hypothetical protein